MGELSPHFFLLCHLNYTIGNTLMRPLVLFEGKHWCNEGRRDEILGHMFIEFPLDLLATIHRIMDHCLIYPNL